MKISVIGTGYVGLVTGTCLAESGNDVICMDIDERKIGMLNSGAVPLYEPGLEELIKRNISSGRLLFTTDIVSAVRNSDFIFIAVGTPPGENGSADLKYVLGAARKIGASLNGYKVIINKSTVPVGTGNKVRAAVAGRTKHKFDVVSNPEFLKEGAAVEDFMKPDRIVVGADNPRAAALMQDLYAPFVRTGKPILIMDIRSAEMTKYASNAMLATKISFINEVANLCELVGADINNVRKGIGHDRRIGFEFLFPGVGYGGSCFPKDVQAIIRTAGEYGYDMKILKSVEEVNYRQKGVLVDKILKYFGARGKPVPHIEYGAGSASSKQGGHRAKGKPLEGNIIGIWGLSFKPKTDDMREASSITIINKLLDAGARIKAHDPEAMAEAEKVFGKRIEYVKDNYEVVNGVDALVVITEWNEFRRPNFEKVKSLMKTPVIFDGRNIYDPDEM